MIRFIDRKPRYDFILTQIEVLFAKTGFNLNTSPTEPREYTHVHRYKIGPIALQTYISS